MCPIRHIVNLRTAIAYLSLLLILLACTPSGLLAQSFWRKNDRNTFIRNVQFNFNIPSARAVGLGGAFVAIADDATAGMANPAGLTILTKPEISSHFKTSRFTHEENAGTAEENNKRRKFHDDVGSQSYLSLVYPYGDFSFSLYRQELINFESNFDAPGFGNVFKQQDLDPSQFMFGNDTRSDIQVNNWGAAMAYKPNKYVSIGMSHIVSTLEFAFYENLFQESIDLRREKVFSVSSNSSDTRYSVNLGIKVEPSRFLTFGAVYRSGPRFKITNTIEDIDRNASIPIIEANQDLVFKVPDVYSAGLAVRPRDNLTLSLDIVRVEYHDLIASLDRNLNEDDAAVHLDQFPHSAFVDSDGIEDLVLNNATEIHFGAEYYFLFGEWMIPVRAGFYTDPAHVVYTTVDNEALRRLFPRADDEIHGTFGFGFVLQNKIQLDAAVNLSSSVAEALLSAVFRF
jgi:long-chain fatty acid transport protein